MSAISEKNQPAEDFSTLETDLLRGTEVEGRYRIERVLASGGMSTIYEAYDHRLERMVALKLLKPQIGRMAELVERFFNEARALAKLRSRHVIRVLDYGRVRRASLPDTPYIVMELLEGVDLGAEITKTSALSATVTTNYILEMCEGLAEAHALGIVHRDIKPENVFLAREPDGTITVKLVDFGISKSPTPSGIKPVTQRSECVGSPQYMSPEQMKALPVDARSDIWSLGTVMFECVTGEFAFLGSTVFEIGARVLDAPLPDLRLRNPGLPEAFVCVVERCLKRNPMHRYQSVQELAHALEPLSAPRLGSSSERIACTLGGLPKAVVDAAASERSLAFTLRINNATRAKYLRKLRTYQGPLALAVIVAIVGYFGLRYPQSVYGMFVEARQKTTIFYDAILR